MIQTNDDKNTFSILTDTTLCTGCESCVAACKNQNNLGKDRAWRWQAEIDDLSSTRFCSIVRRPNGHFVRKQCRHCKEPACASVCIVGALQKTKEGPVIYDSGLCMGCRYCMMACPYGIPRYSYDKAVPYVRKCKMCYDRITKEGKKQPACTEACPYGATIFGNRAEMLAEAHRRIKAEPDKYVQKVYGEHDVGGTGVLYVSDISLGFLGWKPDLGTQPLPELTWAALKKVPPIVAGMSGLMGVIYWTIGRRMKLQALVELEDDARDAESDEGALADGTTRPDASEPQE